MKKRIVFGTLRLMRRLSLAAVVLLVIVCANSLFAGGVVEYLMEEGAATVVGDTSGSINNAYFDGQPVWQTGHGGGSQYCLGFDGNEDTLHGQRFEEHDSYGPQM